MSVFHGSIPAECLLDALFPDLVSYVSQIPELLQLRFSRLNLAHQARRIDMPKFDIVAFALIFDEVDPTLINDFIKMDNFSSTETISAGLVSKRCTLPRFECSFRSTALCLEHIEDAFSIYNALDAWQGPSICFESCPHFDDKLLAWLSNPDHPMGNGISPTYTD